MRKSTEKGSKNETETKLEDDLDAVDAQRLHGLVDQLCRRDESDRSGRGGLAEARVDSARLAVCLARRAPSFRWG